MLVVAEALKSTSPEAIYGQPGESDDTDENLIKTIGGMPGTSESPEQPSSQRSSPESSSLIVAAALNIVGSHAMFGRNWWVMISQSL